MYEQEKCDPELGKRVFEHLKSKGYLTMETGEPFNRDERVAEMKKVVSDMIKTMGLNPDDPQLVETPKRIAKMWVDELMGGLDWSKFPKMTMFPEGKATSGSFVCEVGAPIRSVCAHHFLSFMGIRGDSNHLDFGPGCTIAYIPNGKICGISKLPRLTGFLSARPANQEELCNMIRETLAFLLETEDVAVYMDCYHLCQVARGARANGSMVVLSAGGKFLTDPSIRSEFLAIARNK